MKEDEYDFKIGYGKHRHSQCVGVNDDFLCCPECESIKLFMGAISMPNKIGREKGGVVIKFTCKDCSVESTLALFNSDIGLPELNARINWVDKAIPYVEDAVDKLKSFSLTGQSKKYRRYVEKYNLWDLKAGEGLPEGVPPYRSEDYDKDGNDKVVNIKDKKKPS